MTRRHQYPRTIYRGLLLGQDLGSLHERHFWDFALGLREKRKVSRARRLIPPKPSPPPDYLTLLKAQRALFAIVFPNFTLR